MNRTKINRKSRDLVCISSFSVPESNFFLLICNFGECEAKFREKMSPQNKHMRYKVLKALIQVVSYNQSIKNETVFLRRCRPDYISL